MSFVLIFPSGFPPLAAVSMVRRVTASIRRFAIASFRYFGLSLPSSFSRSRKDTISSLPLRRSQCLYSCRASWHFIASTICKEDTSTSTNTTKDETLHVLHDGVMVKLIVVLESEESFELLNLRFSCESIRIPYL